MGHPLENGLLLVSFDVDGTLEFGDPPGPIAAATPRLLQEAGLIVGSASDRLVMDQERLWHRAGLRPDFVAQKHHLVKVKAQFPAAHYAHVGDGFMDATAATEAGFFFLHVNTLSREEWADLEAICTALGHKGER